MNPDPRSAFSSWDRTGSITEELTQIKQRLTQLSDSFWPMVVIGNNHYRGAELANAIELKSLVTGKKQRVPEGLLRTYPHLERIALIGTEPGCLPF